eukprot:g43607.t1
MISAFIAFSFPRLLQLCHSCPSNRNLTRSHRCPIGFTVMSLHIYTVRPTPPPPQQTSSTTFASHPSNHERQAIQTNIPWVSHLPPPLIQLRQGDDRRRSEERRPRRQCQYTADMLTSQVSRGFVQTYKSNKEIDILANVAALDKAVTAEKEAEAVGKKRKDLDECSGNQKLVRCVAQ